MTSAALSQVCKIHNLPSEGWIFWVPAYYKNNELDIPEMWKIRHEGEELTAYIRPGLDIRIKNNNRADFLITEVLA